MNKQQALEILGLREGATAADITAAVAAKKAEIAAKKAGASSDALAAVFDTFLQRLELAERVLAEDCMAVAPEAVEPEAWQPAPQGQQATGAGAAVHQQPVVERKWWWVGGALALLLVAAVMTGLFLERLMVSRHQVYAVMREPDLTPEGIAPDTMDQVVLVDTELLIMASATGTGALVPGEKYNQFLTGDSIDTKIELHYQDGSYFVRVEAGKTETVYEWPMYPMSRVDIDYYKDHLIGQRESFLVEELVLDASSYPCEISYELDKGEVISLWYEADGSRNVDGKMVQDGDTVAFIPNEEGEDSLYGLEYVFDTSSGFRLYLDTLSADLSEAGDMGQLQLTAGCRQAVDGSYHLVEPFRSWWDTKLAKSDKQGLLEKQGGKIALTIDTVPNATIYILNIKPKYEPGILLEPGEYKILVRADGYQDWNGTVTLRNIGEPASTARIPMTKYTPSANCKSGNCYNGSGTYVYSSGDKYIGAFSGGLRHGQGSYYFADGDHYEGAWASGNKSGKGTYHYQSGDRFVGDYKNDAPGAGIYYSASGERYRGRFVDGSWQND
ncbi:hypothetical protein [Pseudomaricurvus sp. HS19]|uniref:hypothetical protein n=1 Tax=Pseudomaricurvus sp. HS19 TaxID=2692626 RepID=UPI001371E99D|nr:hypothetical protein [Pseudomaricurvus sp. HS19]MYM64347.1 hypothetical protein [Pseudomaricurvus sp. HS19]